MHAYVVFPQGSIFILYIFSIYHSQYTKGRWKEELQNLLTLDPVKELPSLRPCHPFQSLESLGAIPPNVDDGLTPLIKVTRSTYLILGKCTTVTTPCPGKKEPIVF